MAEKGQPGCPLGSPRDGVRDVRQQLAIESENWTSCVTFGSQHNFTEIHLFAGKIREMITVRCKGMEHTRCFYKWKSLLLLWSRSASVSPNTKQGSQLEQPLRGIKRMWRNDVRDSLGKMHRQCKRLADTAVAE